MAERSVSVPVAAVGGDRLKADLAAIGREGKAALAAIAGGSGPARPPPPCAGARPPVGSSRIDRTTGVTGGLRRDAADIEAYGLALDDTRAKYNPMFAAVRSYRAELAAIRAAMPSVRSRPTR